MLSVGICLFAFTMLLSAISPALGAVLGPIWGAVVLTLMLLGLLRAIWLIAADPIFNTLLLLDPLGRNVVPFDPADAAVTGSIVALIMSVIGMAITLPLFGESHPATDALVFLAGGGFVATIFAAAIRSLHGRGRRLAWIGYAMVATALLCVVAARLFDIGGAASSVAAVLVASAGALFTLGLVLFCISYVSAKARRRNAAPNRWEGT